MLKVMAKLGISCVDSYRGAQTFDAVGISQDVMELCFPGSVSPLGGLTFEDIASDVLERHAALFPAETAPALVSPGFVKFHKGGEYHETNPDVVRSLHRTVDPDLASLKSTAARMPATPSSTGHVASRWNPPGGRNSRNVAYSNIDAASGRSHSTGSRGPSTVRIENTWRSRSTMAPPLRRWRARDS